MRRSLRKHLVLVACAGVVGACASPGRFVWVQDYTAPDTAPQRTLIAPGDLLAIQVWRAEQLTGRQRVRTDGRISLFFAADLPVAGLTTAQAADSIAARLDGVIVSPRVNVIIEEAVASTIAVIGEVAHPGRYPAHDAPTLLATLSLAAGLTEFAHRNRIFVLRSTPRPVRIRFTYEQITRGDDLARGFRLLPGDAVIVE